MSSSLSHISALPTPTYTSTDTLVWSLSDIEFLGSGQVTIYVGAPSGSIGTRYPVNWAAGTSGIEADTSNDSSTGEVMLALQLFLPFDSRGH
jgi:hypothetical protein